MNTIKTSDLPKTAFNHAGHEKPAPEHLADIVVLNADKTIVMSRKGDNWRVVYRLSTTDYTNPHDALDGFTDSVLHSGC